MFPNGRSLFIVSIISFASNWQFGYQITYINTASLVFYKFANEVYQKELTYQRSADANASDIIENVTKTLAYDDWSKHWSIIVSSFYPGTFFGFVLVPTLIHRVGVRRSLLCSFYPAVIGCLLQIFIRFFAGFGKIAFVYTMAFGRFLVGIQAGCSLSLLPLFIIEASPNESRPFLSSLQQVFQALSTLIGLAVGFLPFSNLQIEWFQIIAIIPICSFIFILLVLPDTPLHLLECSGDGDLFHNDNLNFQQKFYKSANFYHGASANISEIREEAYSRWNVEMSPDESLKNNHNLKGLIIGSLAAISFSFTADDVIDSYSSHVFYKISSNTIGMGQQAFSQIITVFLGFWLFVTSIFGAFLIDNFGRKRLLIIGLCGTAVSNLFAAVGAAYGSVFIMTIGFVFTKTFIGFGAGAPAWFLTSELVSSKVMCTAQSVSTGALLLMTGLVTFLFLPMELCLGIVWSLVILSTIPALCIAIVLLLFLPETRNRSYADIRYQLTANLLSGFGFFESDEMSKYHRLSTPHTTTPSESGLNFQMPPKYKRLMSASSYASYGSMRNLRQNSLLNTNENYGANAYNFNETENNISKTSFEIF